MRAKQILLFCIALGIPCLSLSGERGDGTRGGGESVDFQGRPSLRDLHDKTVCRWKTGSALRDSLAYLPTLLKSIEAPHWYFANLLFREATRINVCWTKGELQHINTEDEDAVALVKTNAQAVAIRLNDNLYVNEALFSQMSPRDQAYLYIHEMLHSFIPMNVSQRNTKLRSMISIVQENERTRLAREDFAYQIEMNDLKIPSEIQILEPIRDLVLSIFDANSSEEQKQGYAYQIVKPYLKDADPQKALVVNVPLSSADQSELLKLYSGFSNSVYRAITEDNETKVQWALAQGLLVNTFLKGPPISGKPILRTYTDEMYLTPVAWAILSNAPKVANVLIGTHSFNPNQMIAQKSYFGLPCYNDDLVACETTPLFFAIATNNLEVTKQLVHHAKLDLKAKSVFTVYRDSGCWPKAVSISASALVFAIYARNLDFVRPFLEPELRQKININDNTQFGDSALTIAVEFQKLDVAAELLKLPGIDVNAKTSRTSHWFDTKEFFSHHYAIDGLTPLMLSALHGDESITKLLLSNPQLNTTIRNTHSRDISGDDHSKKLFTAKDIAALSGHPSIAKLIEQYERTREATR